MYYVQLDQHPELLATSRVGMPFTPREGGLVYSKIQVGCGRALFYEVKSGMCVE